MKQISLLLLIPLALSCSAGSDTIINNSGGDNNGGGENGVSLATIFAGSYNHGIFRSLDTGKTWTSPSQNVRGLVYGIASNGHALFAATASEGSGSAGIFRSADNGVTWTQLSGVPDSNVFSIYASGSVILAGTRDNAVFRSTDEGSHWTNVATSMQPVLNFVKFGSAIFGSAQGSGVIRSTDNGVTWTALSNGFPASSVNWVTADGQTLYAQTYIKGVYRSTDNGDHWAQLGQNLFYGSGIAAHGATLYVATNTGFFRSIDSGQTWKHIDVIPSFSAYSVATNGNYVFAPSEVNGMFVSADNGTTWQQRNVGLTDTALISVSFK